MMRMPEPVLVEIVDRAAVADDVTGKAPAAAQDVAQQQTARAARLAQGAVVRAHDRFDAGFDQALESGKVGLEQVLGRRAGIEAMPVLLGTAVHGVVLGAGGGLEVARMGALEATDHGRTQFAGEHRVLAERLLPAAPSGDRGRCSRWASRT